MDTYTLFTASSTSYPVNIAIWGSLVFCTALVFYWAATIENDIENNPDK